jgi:hypothetical protein
MILSAFQLAAARETGVLVAVGDRGKAELASDPVMREAAARSRSSCGMDSRYRRVGHHLKGWRLHDKPVAQR